MIETGWYEFILVAFSRMCPYLMYYKVLNGYNSMRTLPAIPSPVLEPIRFRASLSPLAIRSSNIVEVYVHLS